MLRIRRRRRPIHHQYPYVPFSFSQLFPLSLSRTDNDGTITPPPTFSHPFLLLLPFYFCSSPITIVGRTSPAPRAQTHPRNAPRRPRTQVHRRRSRPRRAIRRNRPNGKTCPRHRRLRSRPCRSPSPRAPIHPSSISLTRPPRRPRQQGTRLPLPTVRRRLR